MPYTADNIEINIATGTAVLATDYGTSGLGFTSSHAQVSKIAWGDENVTYRAGEAYPLPVTIYGSSGGSVDISGTISGTGSFFVRNTVSTPIIVRGSTNASDAAVVISGRVQGITNGTGVGICGPVTVTNNIAVFGVSGATAIGITGGRRLNSSSDSVTVTGSVGISGISMSAASHSVAVYGSDLGGKVLTRVYGSDGATLGMSGDALKVALVNPGINFSVSYTSTVGVTNGTEGALRVQGYTGSSGTPVTIKGSLAGGAVEIGAVTAIPVGVCGSVEINDTNLISSLESTSKPLISNLSSINTNTLVIETISNKLSSAAGANVTVKEIKRPSTIINGQRSVNATPTAIGSSILKVGVTIKSLRSNIGAVYVGSGVTLTPSNGYILDPGDSVFIETDDLKRVFVRTDAGISATISYISS